MISPYQWSTLQLQFWRAPWHLQYPGNSVSLAFGRLRWYLDIHWCCFSESSLLLSHHNAWYGESSNVISSQRYCRPLHILCHNHNSLPQNRVCMQHSPSYLDGSYDGMPWSDATWQIELFDLMLLACIGSTLFLPLAIAPSTSASTTSTSTLSLLDFKWDFYGSG